ncbi:MAG TPA: type II secretion system F family protein [Nitratifractor sp.]|nr:type II secretion system F family protein [Nitratifractor sp.]
MYYEVEYLYRGQKKSKSVEAENAVVASSQVKKEQNNIIVISTKEVGAPASKVMDDMLKQLNSYTSKNISVDEKIAAIRQIAVMTDAGLPIYDVLEDIVENSKNPALKNILSQAANDINAGKSMSQALDPHKEQMGHIVMAMTKLGEKTGNFSASYMKLAEILEVMRENRSKFLKAIRYPITVIAALIIAFIIVITQVVPKFREIFAELGADLPLATKFLLATESFLSNYGLYIILVLVLLFFIFRFFYKSNPEFRLFVDRILANKRFYLIGKVVYLANIYNYILVLESLIKAGIPVSEALETAVRVVENSYIKQQLQTINTNIGKGVSLSEAFEKTGLFENMILQMIRAGESSGQLDHMLGKARDYYNMKFQNLIDNLSAYIEPIMITMIAGLVLLLALGIFMPMWDLGRAARG